jgi:hypothetical protein
MIFGESQSLSLLLKSPALLVASWNERQALARQALLTCLDRATLTLAVHLKSAQEIWTSLAKEYGHVSDIKRGEAQTAFYGLVKNTSTPMADHIDLLVQLQQQVDYHRPPSIEPISNLETNRFPPLPRRRMAYLSSVG